MSSTEQRVSSYSEPIHLWFELSYASYLVLPRSVLQSTPIEWQRRFVECLEELNDMCAGLRLLPDGAHYDVFVRGDRGRRVRDDFAAYERGRRRVALQIPEASAYQREADARQANGGD